MNKDFKEIIAPFLFEGKEYCPQFCSFVDGWPEITHKDQWHREEVQKVSNENVRVVDYSDESITVQAGNEYQGNISITIIAIDGKAIVESSKIIEAREVEAGNNQEITNMFADINIGERIYKKSAAVWQMELNMAIKNEDYEKATMIRNAMEKEGLTIRK